MAKIRDVDRRFLLSKQMMDLNYEEIGRIHSKNAKEKQKILDGINEVREKLASLREEIKSI